MAVQPTNRPKFSFQSKCSSQEISKFLEGTDNKDLFFSFCYWQIAAVGSTARDLLEYGGVKHEKLALSVGSLSVVSLPHNISSSRALTTQHSELNVLIS